MRFDDNSPLTEFAEALARARSAAKLSYRALARASGINFIVLHELEHGKHPPTFDAARTLSRILKKPDLLSLARDSAVWWWERKSEFVDSRDRK